MSLLPQELTDIILDPFYDDPQTLIQCALVCRSWSYRCRHLIFQNITIDCEHRSANFRVNSLCRAVAYNKRLTEIISSLELQNFRWPCTCTFHDTTLKALGRLFLSLQHVRRITLQNVRWFSFPYRLKVAFSELLKRSSLEELYLDEFVVAHHSTLGSFINCAPNLKVLQLKNVAAHEIQPAVTMSPEIFFRITRQRSDDIDGGDCLMRLPQDKDFRHLETFHVETSDDSTHIMGCLQPDFLRRLQHTRNLHISDQTNPQVFQLLLQATRSSLEHLTITSSEDYSELDSVDVHLRDFPNLKSLELSRSMSLAAIEQIFSNIGTSDHPLEKFCMSPGYGEIGWGAADDFLTQYELANLRRVDFILHGPLLIEEIEHTWKQFPKLRKRGILHIIKAEKPALVEELKLSLDDL